VGVNGTVLGMSATADGRTLAFTFTAPTAGQRRTCCAQTRRPADGPAGRVVLPTAAIGSGQVALNRSGRVLLACTQNAAGKPRQTARLAAYKASTGIAIGVLRKLALRVRAVHDQRGARWRLPARDRIPGAPDCQNRPDHRPGDRPPRQH